MFVEMLVKEIINGGEGFGVGGDVVAAAVGVDLIGVLYAGTRQLIREQGELVAIFLRFGVAGVQEHGGGVFCEIIGGAVIVPTDGVLIARSPGFIEALEHRVVGIEL